MNVCIWKVFSLGRQVASMQCMCSMHRTGLWHVWCVQGERHKHGVCVWHVKWCMCGVHAPCIGMHVGHMQHACGICEMCISFACGMCVGCTQCNYHVLTTCMQCAYGMFVVCMHEACLHFACRMCGACMRACDICAFPKLHVHCVSALMRLHISWSVYSFFAPVFRNWNSVVEKRAAL